jgi:transposase
VLRDRHHTGTVPTFGLAIARGRLLTRLGTMLDRISRVPDVERFAAHLTTEYAEILEFLFAPTLDATNWLAEQTIRPAVVARKMAGDGKRSPRGATTQQNLTSVLRAAQLRHIAAASVIVNLRCCNHRRSRSPPVTSTNHRDTIRCVPD